MVERVAAIRELDELLVVAAFGVGDAMEGIGIAACTVNIDFQIATGVVWLAFWGDVIGLLQEVVVGSPHGAIRRSEDCGFVEAISGNGQVFVDIGDMVHVLVPYRSGWCPVTGIAEHVESANAGKVG